MGKNHQLTVCHREELYTPLYVPSGTIQSLFEKPVGLVDTGCFVSTFDICIPIRMEAIVKIGYERKIFRIHGCRRCRHYRSLHIADDTHGIQSLTGIHHIEISNNRSLFVDIGCRQVKNVLALGLLSPRCGITQMHGLVGKPTVPVQGTDDRNLGLGNAFGTTIYIGVFVFPVAKVGDLKYQLLSRREVECSRYTSLIRCYIIIEFTEFAYLVGVQIVFVPPQGHELLTHRQIELFRRFPIDVSILDGRRQVVQSMRIAILIEGLAEMPVELLTERTE